MNNRHLGPGDIETWGQCSNPRDPRWVEPDEPEVREDELLSLKPSQVDLHRRHAWVGAGNAKSGYARAVPLNEDALQVMKRRLPKAVAFVFERPPRQSDAPIKIYQTDARDFKRACAKVGIEDFSFHDLRHTWASWHVQSGTPLMVLKELGG